MATEKFWKLGIIGWPLGYSLSPVMHRAALKAAGLQGDYQEYPIEPDLRDPGNYKKVTQWLSAARDEKSWDGVNVTMPYKSQAAVWCSLLEKNSADRFAKYTNAVNTIRFQEGSAWGYNTDGVGFLQPLQDRGLDRSGWRVLLLGAGGAAKAIATALTLEKKVRRLLIWSRGPGRAENLADRVNTLYYGAPDQTGFAEGIERFTPALIQEADCLVNATPVGMKEKEELLINTDWLRPGQIVYDIVYEPRRTPLITAALGRGCRVITGDEMLVAQGACSFKIWTGIDEVNGKSVREIMREALNERFAAGR